MALRIREFTMADYDSAVELWKKTEGIGLSEADERHNIHGFLGHNLGMSFVAEDGERLVGAVLCGTDARRGFLHHLAVDAAHRRSGIGRALVERCLQALAARGMRKCHIFVIADNLEGRRFWQGIGWEERTTLVVMSHDVVPAGGSSAGPSASGARPASP
jgi:ribosomal protein S18 acetylase RimI-like enzyme